MGDLYEAQRLKDKWLLGEVAWVLLEFCDPEQYALTCNITGLNVYPRCHSKEVTAWERELWGLDHQLPAAWTGYLSRYLGPRFGDNENNSATSSRFLVPSLTVRPGQNHRRRSSSKTPSLTRPVYPSSGLNPGRQRRMRD